MTKTNNIKVYKPLFSAILIVIQFILSLISHFEHIEMIKELEKTNPGLSGLISFSITYKTLFLFILIIGFYEMLTKPSWFKTAIRIFLVCIILGTQFAGLVPIDDFYFGVYNTTWFSAVVVIVLILMRIGKYSIEKINNNKLNKASR